MVLMVDATQYKNQNRRMNMKIIVKLFFCLLLVMLNNTYSQPVTWDLSDGGNGHVYEAIVVEGGVTWTNARNAAVAMGGDLVSITSAEENTFVFSLIETNVAIWYSESNTYGPWIGAIQAPGSQEPSGGWEWVDGEPMDYTAWNTYEPNNNVLLSEYAHFFGLGRNHIQPLWNDTSPDFICNGYIVEYTDRPDLASTIRIASIDICWPGETNRQYQVQYSSAKGQRGLPAQCVIFLLIFSI